MFLPMLLIALAVRWFCERWLLLVLDRLPRLPPLPHRPPLPHLPLYLCSLGAPRTRLVAGLSPRLTLAAAVVNRGSPEYTFHSLRSTCLSCPPRLIIFLFLLLQSRRQFFLYCLPSVFFLMTIMRSGTVSNFRL